MAGLVGSQSQRDTSSASISWSGRKSDWRISTRVSVLGSGPRSAADAGRIHHIALGAQALLGPHSTYGGLIHRKRPDVNQVHSPLITSTLRDYRAGCVSFGVRIFTNIRNQGIVFSRLFAAFRDRLMVGHQVLVLGIGVRIPIPEHCAQYVVEYDTL